MRARPLRRPGLRRRRGLLLVAAGLALAACSGGGGPSDPGDPMAPDTDGDGLADDLELELALQFRPVWAFDAAEEIWPIAVEEWAAFGGRIVLGGAVREYADPAGLVAAAAALPAGTMETVADVRSGAAPCAAGTGCDHAPVYVDAVPAGFSHRGRSNLVWLHYWLFFHFDRKVLPPSLDLSHYGDWEHVCVLVARDDRGRSEAAPVGLHFHAHGNLTVADAAFEWHADPACAGGAGAAGCRGTRHPAAYVEANGHGMFAAPGETALGPHFGARLNPAEQLDNPLVFVTPHSTRGAAVMEAVRAFRGRWGQTPNASPFGPLVPTDACDHDWDPAPTLADWLPACRD